jgi:hypothetical protein
VLQQRRPARVHRIVRLLRDRIADQVAHGAAASAATGCGGVVGCEMRAGERVDLHFADTCLIRHRAHEQQGREQKQQQKSYRFVE